jgi:uncharacterized protein
LSTATRARVLVDTGPLVAWFDANDSYHASVSRFLDRYEGELISTWPVLTETCHLLPESLVPSFMMWVARGGLTIADLPPSSALALADRMGKYADLPMDLADASLIWLAENLGVLDVLTLDRRDFGVYRTDRGKALRNLLEVREPGNLKPRSRRPKPSK